MTDEWIDAPDVKTPGPDEAPQPIEDPEAEPESEENTDA